MKPNIIAFTRYYEMAKTGTFDKVDSRLACPSIRQEATGLATPGCIRGGDVGHSVPIVK